MLKILAVFVLIWMFFKALGMIFRTLLGGSSDQHKGNRYGGNFSNKGTNSKVKVDHESNKSSEGYRGGEYVDYEEIE